MHPKHRLPVVLYLLAALFFIAAIPDRMRKFNLMATGLALWALGRIIELIW
jgi:hypothetical protein